LLRYLTDQLANPQAQGEAAQMRLETDAELVQVITFHKAKGLQYPLVFLPFASNFKEDTDDLQRTEEERLQEDIRLLYVALTRAEQAMWLGVAKRQKDFKEKSNAPHSALSVLLQRKSADDLAQQLETWKSCADISVTLAPEANDTLYVPCQPSQPSQANQADTGTFAKRPSRVLPNAGWTASFSALTRKLHESATQQTDSGLARDARWQDSQIDIPRRQRLRHLAARHLRMATQRGLAPVAKPIRRVSRNPTALATLVANPGRQPATHPRAPDPLPPTHPPMRYRAIGVRSTLF
jgi:exodeoxyribonuclease V beta subunit